MNGPEQFIPNRGALDLHELAEYQLRKHQRDRYPGRVRQFIKLVDEIGELAEQINKDHDPGEPLKNELADVALSLFTLAAKCGVNLNSAVYELVMQDDRVFGGIDG